ncbi:MAG TPA: hypothetical protein PKO01_08040, partial [Smithellaceae bacterium]|nr:hypothetical protein [Smithellaceae bacterium]
MTSRFEDKHPTLSVFEKNVRGIQKLIKAADVYAQHIISIFRNKDIDENLIKRIIKSDSVSSLNFAACSYSPEEIKVLERVGHLREIGQQIILASYAALELYLINKFKEYYKYILRDKNKDFVNNSLKILSFRNIKEIKNHYYDLLAIHLPSFDIIIYTDTKCNWQPHGTWEAILLLEETRHQIAHTGISTCYKINTLMDSWFPFEFVCEWVRT